MTKPFNLFRERLFREALSTVAQAERVDSLDELQRIFRPVFCHLGFSLHAGIEVADVVSAPSIKVLFGRGYEPWCARYESMGYAKDDPVIKELGRTLDPFFWSDVLERTEPSARALQIMYDARAHGFTEGFVAPLIQVDQSIVVVMLAGSKFDSRDHYARAAASIVSTYYGMLGRQLLDTAKFEKPVVLTPRQLECLRWAREGKSSADISTILGISVDVVDEHIARACKRLSVRTRMQAVIAAVIGGYLDP